MKRVHIGVGLLFHPRGVPKELLTMRKIPRIPILEYVTYQTGMVSGRVSQICKLVKQLVLIPSVWGGPEALRP